MFGTIDKGDWEREGLKLNDESDLLNEKKKLELNDEGDLHKEKKKLQLHDEGDLQKEKVWSSLINMT